MDTWDHIFHHLSVVPMFLPLPTPLHPTCLLSLYHHGSWRLCSGCGARSTTECMGDIGQWTTLLRPSNGYMRPCFPPFVSGAYVLAPPHPSTSHLPSWASITTGPRGSAVAGCGGRSTMEVWVTLVNELPYQDLVMDTWDHVLHHSSVVPMFLPLPTPLHPTCLLSLYHHPCQIYLVYLRTLEALQWLWHPVYHGVYG